MLNERNTIAATLAFLLAVAAGGCGSDSGQSCGPGTIDVDGVCVVAGSDGGVGGKDAMVQHDQAIIPDTAPPKPEPTNNFAKHKSGALRFSFTDASGAIACSLVDNPATPLPYEGVQIYALFTYFGGKVCPTGTYSLSAANECSASFPANKNCARYRLWDKSGSISEENMASTGALVVDAEWVDSLWSRCTFDLELVFPGGVVFKRNFGILYSSSDSSLPDAC